ncbi:hypothetical protein [Roseovarius autotrophicus]|uniref:hypothetical protein n=1 Tax=Roseovarius autotrophicus TaxID=2824121 RepID=UPI001B378587|nr:hypothetical protein [Roseovarius autotrophicus]
MKQSNYTRPTKTDASKLGERRRHYWSRLLRKRAYWSLPVIEMMTAEETHANIARSRRGENKAAWINISLRVDHIAVIEVLQKVHLRNTGKEISRAEVLAALMAAGLHSIVNHENFGGNGN